MQKEKQSPKEIKQINQKLSAENKILKTINAKLKNLIKLTGLINSTKEVDSILEIMIKSTQELVKAEAVCIFLIDDVLKEIYLIRTQEGETSENLSFKIGEGIAGWVAKNQQSVLIPQIVKDTRFDPKVDQNVSFPAKSIISVPLKIKDEIIGILEVINKTDSDSFDKEDLELLEILSPQLAIAFERNLYYENLENLCISIICVIGDFIESRDPLSHGHTEEVVKYSLIIAEEINLSSEEKKKLRSVALLHDIGKLIIPEEVLRKKEKLNEQEWYLVKKHPEIGADIFKDIKQLKEVIPGILYHQEKFDGTGYPMGLVGNEINKFARIVAIADAFVSMTTERTYQERLSPEEALQELRRESGRQFDPEYIKAFLQGYKNRESEFFV